MSFEAQEKALFDLLFDHRTREKFCLDRQLVLSSYDLAEDEIQDFAGIRNEALELDAAMRTYLLLVQLARVYPVAFSIISSFDDGIRALKQLVDVEVMRKSPVERAAAYGGSLREWLENCEINDEKNKAMIMAIVGAEFGMVWAATTLKQAALQGNVPVVQSRDLPGNWDDLPLKFAAYVCAVIIPQSYHRLKQALCTVEEGELWPFLQKTPPSHEKIDDTLSQEEPCLLVTRAVLTHRSSCDPATEHRTVELSEGFAPLFQHIDGTRSTRSMMEQLQQAGAPEIMLQGVRQGFYQLLHNGMLETN